MVVFPSIFFTVRAGRIAHDRRGRVCTTIPSIARRTALWCCDRGSVYVSSASRKLGLEHDHARPVSDGVQLSRL